MNKYMKYFLRVFVFLLICIVSILVLFLISKSRTFQFFGEIIPRVETEEKVVALTFDDAPTKYSDQVLELLVEKNIPATFYVIGQNLEKYPAEGKRIVNMNHELGNHSYTHPRFYFQSQQKIREEIENTNKRIRAAGYTGDITFRPPFGKKLFGLPWYLDANHIKTITWDVEPETENTFPEGEEKTKFLVENTLEKTRPGSIIIFHPFCASECQSTREALPIIIDELKKRGYKFVSISELLSYQKGN